MKTWEVIKTLKEGTPALRAVNVNKPTLIIKTENNSLVCEDGSRFDINRYLDEEWEITNGQRQVDLITACQSIANRDKNVLVYIDGKMMCHYSAKNPQCIFGLNEGIQVNYILNGTWFLED